jgi:hypothetical protein
LGLAKTQFIEAMEVAPPDPVSVAPREQGDLDPVEFNLW